MSTKTSAIVVDRTHLAHEDLLDVAHRNLSAIRIKNYYDDKTCRMLSGRLMDSSHYGKYINAPKIGRVGQAFFESQASEASRKRYERESVQWMQEIRDACLPFLSPIDRLRLELDEVWPSGSKLGRLENMTMFAGLARHFGPGSEAEPHTDVLEWDAPDNPMAKEVEAQLATNTYLTVPEIGGDLLLWDVWPSQEEYHAMQKPGSYGLRQEELPAPQVRIAPEVGELIVFNSRRVHAVERIDEGSRVTWSSFVGIKDTDNPLFVWS